MLSVWGGAVRCPVLLFLPGTMTHPLFYEELLDALSRAGVTVVGLHSQGHGKSPRARRLDAVFAHNVLDPSLPSSIGVTRLPGWLAQAYPAVMAAFRLAARLAPGLPVPFGAYLDMDRVCTDPANVRRFWIDPLGLRSYPLAFLASLLTADLSGMHDGSIACPGTVIAGRGDRLFPLEYTREVFDRLVAARTELLAVESDVHLLFKEDLDAVLPQLLSRLRALTTERRVPATALA